MKRSKVVVVEDDEEMAEMLRHILKPHFDEVKVCTTKAYAIDQAKQDIQDNGVPDAMIIDILVNGESGIDLYHWIKESQDRMPGIMFLTGCHPESPEYTEAKSTNEIVHDKDKFSSDKMLEQVKGLAGGSNRAK